MIDTSRLNLRKYNMDNARAVAETLTHLELDMLSKTAAGTAVKCCMAKTLSLYGTVSADGIKSELHPPLTVMHDLGLFDNQIPSWRRYGWDSFHSASSQMVKDGIALKEYNGNQPEFKLRLDADEQMKKRQRIFANADKIYEIFLRFQKADLLEKSNQQTNLFTLRDIENTKANVIEDPMKDKMDEAYQMYKIMENRNVELTTRNEELQNRIEDMESIIRKYKLTDFFNKVRGE